MTKHYTLALSFCCAALLFSSTNETFASHAIAKPFVKTASTPRSIAASVVVDEDFSLFTAGSETTPDATNIAEDYTVPDNYTHQSGWVGGGVHQAGGTCALYPHDNGYGSLRDGFISTPVMELYGDVTLTFRAKRGTGSQANLSAVICDDYEGPLEDFRDYTLTDEWQTFTYNTDKASFDLCNFQISAEGGVALVDDIRIERMRTRIATPYAGRPVNNSLTEFSVEWEPVADAKDYLLNVYYTAMPDQQVSGTISQNFDGINVNSNGTTINLLNPNYPEGWTINVSARGKQDVATGSNCSSAPIAIMLDAEGDEIISPETPAEINHISFWIKPTSMDYEDDMISMISVLVYYTNTQRWERIANIPNFYIEDGATCYEFDSDQIGDYVKRIKIEYLQEGDNKVGFMIDDMTLDYATQPQPIAVVDNKAVAGTSYTVSDIDPERDYFYYVQARDGELLSDPSERMWVDGLTGLKPTVKEATDVTTTGFTANWERMPKADSYKVDLSKVVEATSAMTDVVVLEEDFSLITEGTISAPGQTWGNANLGEMGMANTSWVLTQPIWANGMAGTSGTSWAGTAGLVASPYLSLNNNGGKFTVNATVYNTVADDVIFVMVLNSIYDTQATDAQQIQCAAPGLTNKTVTFENSGKENILVAFMSMSGEAFFVDDVVITQDLNPGEKLSAPFSSVTNKSADNFYTFTGLPEGADYAYSVTAMRKRAYDNYTSNRSDAMVAPTASSAGIGTVTGNDSAITVTGTNGAIMINATEAGTDVTVVDMHGRTVSTASTEAGTIHIKAIPGIYIVKAGETAVKVAVK